MASEPTDRPALRALADRVGIVSEYLDQSGTETRVTSDETRVALLAAMGLPAATESDAAGSLHMLAERERARLLPPARVVRVDAADLQEVRVLAPPGWRGEVGWSLALVTETERIERTGRARPDEDGALVLRLPVAPAPGHHRVHLRLHFGREHPEAEQRLIVVPPHAPTPNEMLGGRRVFGITANLYTVRSARNWGVGDLTDVAELARWGGEIGASFVGLNPLHALRGRAGDISPYSPVSRLFRNALYLDVEAIPELAESPEARALIEAPAFRAELAAVRAADAVQYDRVTALERRVLEPLFATFVRLHRDAGTARGRDFAGYVRSQGEALDDFATFLAIEEAIGAGPGAPADWRTWPEPLRHPRGDAVEAFRAGHRDAIDFHRWLQFELDRQLAEAARVAREAGMALGLYQDLAIASSPAGSDAWAYRELLVEDVSLGAPPDDYSEAGQNWGMPPLHPLRLAEDGYRYWITLLRSAFRHAGAVRIDHILGLFRQFWIPDGKAGGDGAYVRFPTEDLLGILALEAHRAGALVVGEDLGTVPPDVPPALARWGILGSRVLYFERGADGFRPADSYEPLSLTTANTHDMATLEGFWAGRDIDLKHAAAIIGDAEASAARAERVRERAQLLSRLAADGAMPDDALVAGAGESGLPREGGAALRGAIHDFLCRTPAALVALSLDDLVGEMEPVNLPGVGGDVYASWTRRLRLPVERLRADPGVRRALGRCARWRDAKHD